MFDIARILYSYCDAEVKREAEQTVIDEYCRLLHEGMAKEGRNLDFNVEQVNVFVLGLENIDGICSFASKF